jgi:hypothetical protein
MVIQYLIIGLLAAAALFFMARRVWQAFFAKGASACAKGCGGACGTIDVDRLQRTIEAQAMPPARR